MTLSTLDASSVGLGAGPGPTVNHATQPSAPPLEPGSQVAEAIYLVMAGQRQVNIVVRDGPGHIAAAAAIAAIASARGLFPVDLCSCDRAVRVALIKAVSDLGAGVESNYYSHAEMRNRQMVVVGYTESDNYDFVNVVVSDPAITRRMVASGRRAIFVTTHPVAHSSDIVPEWAVTETPIDVVLAGAPADQWGAQQ